MERHDDPLPGSPARPGHPPASPPTPARPTHARASTYLYCLAFLAFGLEANLLGPTIPELASRTGKTEEDFGPVFTLTGERRAPHPPHFSKSTPPASVVSTAAPRPAGGLPQPAPAPVAGLTCLIGSFPSGYLVDRLPGHAILAVALALQVRGAALHPGLACRATGMNAARQLPASGSMSPAGPNSPGHCSQQTALTGDPSHSLCTSTDSAGRRAWHPCAPPPLHPTPTAP
jgi:hypothetical protein